MVNFCAVVGCSQSGVKGFFRIPAVPSHLGVQTEELSSKRRKQWLANIARTDLNSEAMYQYRVCSKHFLTGMFLFFPLTFVHKNVCYFVFLNIRDILKFCYLMSA